MLRDFQAAVPRAGAALDDEMKDDNEIFRADDYEERDGVHTWTINGREEQGTLVIGPWDEPDTAYQRGLARVMDWLAEARVNYFPGAFFEIHLFGGVLKLRENGDLILNVWPLMRGFEKLFDWMWKAGLP